MTRRDEQGAAAVEMALVMPLLFMLLFGIVVFGIQLFRIQSMEAAVREGGRVAAVRADVRAIKDRVLAEQRLAGSDADDADFTWSFTLDGATYTGGDTSRPCSDTTRGKPVGVTVSAADPAAYALHVPFVGPVTPTFAASAVFRCE